MIFAVFLNEEIEFLGTYREMDIELIGKSQMDETFPQPSWIDK